MAKEVLTFDSLDEDLAPHPQEDSTRIDAVGIIGGGVMGRGLAQTFSSHALNVIIVERDEARVDACKAGLEENLNREIQRWAITESEKRALLARITITSQFDLIRQSDLVIEVVDEKLELKQKIVSDIHAICDPRTIIASGTSTLSLTKIAAAIDHPEKVIGMHFSNPVPKSTLCEIVRGIKTSDETFRRTKEFIESIGKTPVEVYEYPGFITTRVIIPMLNEAMYVLMEGISSAEDIDTAMRLAYNFPVGPLELADTMGLEELLAWMESLFRELGEAKYRPCPLLRRKVREQKLGKKTGEGFFRYDANGKRISSILAEERHT